MIWFRRDTMIVYKDDGANCATVRYAVFAALLGMVAAGPARGGIKLTYVSFCEVKVLYGLVVSSAYANVRVIRGWVIACAILLFQF